MSDMPPPPPDDSSGSSQPPSAPPTGPQAATGWATLGTGGSVELAVPLRRLGARVLDAVIVVLIQIIAVAIGVASAMGLDAADWTDSSVGAFLAFVLLAAIIGVLYEVTMIAVKGQTLGKMAASIKVVRADNGLVPGWGKSVGRWIIPMVLTFVPFVGWLLSILVYISLLWDKVRQGWHDKAAGTLVIKA